MSIPSLPELQELFEMFLTDHPIPDTSENLYDPIRYIMSMGGKRVRPLLCLLTCAVARGKVYKAFHAAMTVEYFHNFTLMHDDIMDNADLRRGKPTVHKRYNINSAILSGDALLVMAYDSLSRTPNTCRDKLTALFNRTAEQVCRGQQMDIDFEATNLVSIEQYIEMITLKTAVLIACSIQMGAIISGISEQDCISLYRFGENLGIAFQLQDDFLDIYGTETSFGKKKGGDILNNKKTHLLLHALEHAQPQDREILLQWLAQNTDNDADATAKIEAITAIFDRTGAPEALQHTMQEYYNKALQNLSDVQLPDIRKNVLAELAESLMNRNV